PRQLVAADGGDFDRLVTGLRRDGPAWASELDLDALVERTVAHIGPEHVSLRFPVGESAARVGEFRRRAREECGRNSGAELAWKATANTMYGVMVCPH